MPDNWCKVELSKLVGASGAFSDGDWVESKDQDPNGEVRLVQLADVGELTFTNRSDRWLAATKAGELRCLYLKKGDILISRLGDPLGKACIYPGGDNAAVTVVDVCVLRIGHNFVDSQLLAYFINSPHVRAQIESHASGTTRKRITGKKLKRTNILLPPLNEQKRIVDKIERLFSHLDEGKALLKQVQKQIATYRQAILKAAVTGDLTREWRAANRDKLESGEELLQGILEERRKNWRGRGNYKEPAAPDTNGLPELPEGWLYVSLAHLIAGIEAGKSFRCLERPPSEDEVGVAKVSAVSWGSYNEQESKTCLDPKKINSSYFIKEGDLLVSRANTIDLVGASVLVKGVSRKIMLSDKTLRLRGLLYPSEYLLLMLRSTLIREQIKKLSTGNQESMRNISQGNLLGLAMPIPSLQEAEAIRRLTFNLLDSAERLSKEIEVQISTMERLRKSVLASAFSGKLVDQDPNDEPASELLARIQKEQKQTTASLKPKRGRASKKSVTV